MKVELGREPAALSDYVQRSFASRLAGRDATLWGPEAEDEASRRLAWVDLPQTSRPLLTTVSELRELADERGLDRIVLCGMGGSSLGPEVVCRAAGVELVVLDSSSPDQVRAALTDELERTLVVVSSKSGGTVETDSQRRAFECAYHDQGRNPSFHLVVVTDPGSPLSTEAAEAGYTVVHADPEVGGRFSVLSAFGLIPSGLAGAGIETLLDEAAEAHGPLTGDDPANPGLRLGLFLAEAARGGRDKLVLVDHTGWGLGDWIEQLVAESTGKSGTGILPIIVGGPDSCEAAGDLPDAIVVHLGAAEVTGEHAVIAERAVIGEHWAVVDGRLGEQFLLWEIATAVAGAQLGIDPFDQPDVERAKAAARDLLGVEAGETRPSFVDGPTSGYVGAAFDSQAETVAEAVRDLLELVVDDRYLAICVYLDREEHAGFASIREALAARLRRPVTFGWGPRFLHSTGQFHKGGPPSGVFLQITADPEEDLPVPGREFTFDGLLAAQASGDGEVLGSQGLPVLRLHLSAASPGLAYLSGVLQ